MNLELTARLHKELSITGSALYEAILAISERVNRKVQIMRLHWYASALLQHIEQVTGEAGQQLVDHVSRRFLISRQSDSPIAALDAMLSHATVRVHELKQSLLVVDAQIRELKLEAIHDDLLRLQRDLSLRSAGIERLTVTRRAPAVGQPIRAMPRPSSVQIATVLRGPFLLSPSDDLVFRPDDIVVMFGLQSDLAQSVAWLTSPHPMKTPTTKSA
jgi:hypothetical protein